MRTVYGTEVTADPDERSHKFSDPLAEYLYERLLNGDDGDESFSDGQGYWINRYGRHVIEGDDQGFVQQQRFGTVAKAQEHMQYVYENVPAEYDGFIGQDGNVWRFKCAEGNTDDVIAYSRDGMIRAVAEWSDRHGFYPAVWKDEAGRGIYSIVPIPDVADLPPLPDLDTDARYMSREIPGVALYIVAVEPYLAAVTMVGDDRVITVDVDTLRVLRDDEYCGTCGQVGCEHG